MTTFFETFVATLPVIQLSLIISLSATLLATCLALPVGAAIAIHAFPGRTLVIATLNALTGLPPVVVGLLVYVMLSRAGPLGELGLLFTPPAMIIAQTILVFPLICAITRQTIADRHDDYCEFFRSINLSLPRSAMTLLIDARLSLVTAVIAGFGRAIAEVGSVLIVGGNIKGVTRVMTTSITFETSKGNLHVALTLGAILVLITIVLNGAVALIQTHARNS